MTYFWFSLSKYVLKINSKSKKNESDYFNRILFTNGAGFAKTATVTDVSLYLVSLQTIGSVLDSQILADNKSQKKRSPRTLPHSAREESSSDEQGDGESVGGLHPYPALSMATVHFEAFSIFEYFKQFKII